MILKRWPRRRRLRFHLKPAIPAHACSWPVSRRVRRQTVAFMTAHLALRHGCSGTARAALGHPPFGLAHCQFRRRAAVLAVET
jgi:hypothetical protein